MDAQSAFVWKQPFSSDRFICSEIKYVIYVTGALHQILDEINKFATDTLKEWKIKYKA